MINITKEPTAYSFTGNPVIFEALSESNEPVKVEIATESKVYSTTYYPFKLSENSFKIKMNISDYLYFDNKVEISSDEIISILPDFKQSYQVKIGNYTFNGIVLCGGISNKVYRELMENGHDIFSYRLLSYNNQFLFTTRTNGNEIKIKETELYPFVFCHPGTQIVFKSNLGAEVNSSVQASGTFCAMNIKSVLNQMPAGTKSIQVLVGGKYTFHFTILSEKLSEEKYLLRFRNSLGAFEVLEVTGKAMHTPEFSEENKWEALTESNFYEERRSRVKSKGVIEVESGYKKRSEFHFILDLIQSDEIYFIYPDGDLFRCHVTSDGAQYRHLMTEPTSVKLKIKPVLDEEFTGLQEVKQKTEMPKLQITPSYIEKTYIAGSVQIKPTIIGTNGDNKISVVSFPSWASFMDDKVVGKYIVFTENNTDETRIGSAVLKLTNFNNSEAYFTVQIKQFSATTQPSLKVVDEFGTDVSSVNFNAEKGYKYTNVVFYNLPAGASKDFHIENSFSWINLSVITDPDPRPKVLLIRTDENDSGFNRRGFFKVVHDELGIDAYITINQSSEGLPVIVVTPSYSDVSAAAQYIDYQVQITNSSVTSYTFPNLPDWITITNNTSNGFRANLTANPGASRKISLQIKLGEYLNEGANKTVFINQQPVAAVPTLNISPASINALVTGETKAITVNISNAANNNYSITGAGIGEWLTVTNKTVNGFSLIISSNVGGTNRETDITVKLDACQNAEAKKVLSITQIAVPEPTIILNKHTATIAAVGGSENIGVTITSLPNTPYTLGSLPGNDSFNTPPNDWITAINRTQTGFTLVLSANTTGVTRTHTVYAKLAGFSSYDSIIITQPPTPPLMSLTPDESMGISFGPGGGTLPVLIQISGVANKEYEVLNLSSWLTVAKIDNEYFALTCQPIDYNNNSESRDAQITIKLVENNYQVTYCVLQHHALVSPDKNITISPLSDSFIEVKANVTSNRTINLVKNGTWHNYKSPASWVSKTDGVNSIGLYIGINPTNVKRITSGSAAIVGEGIMVSYTIVQAANIIPTIKTIIPQIVLASGLPPANVGIDINGATNKTYRVYEKNSATYQTPDWLTITAMTDTYFTISHQPNYYETQGRTVTIVIELLNYSNPEAKYEFEVFQTYSSPV